MIEAVLFDMDGILVDSEPAWHIAHRQIYSQFGKTWTDEDHMAVMGVSTAEWVRYMRAGLDGRIEPDDLKRQVLDHLVEFYRQGIPFIDGAVKAVEHIQRQFRVGLASGSTRQLIEIVIQAPEFEGCFEVALSADQVARGKPHPDVYLECAARLGVSPGVCLVVEDSGNGIEAGHNAGMKVVAIPQEGQTVKTEQLSLADHVLGSIDELSVEWIQRAF